MNIVVTGGSGGLGREVVSRLREEHRVVAASRRTGVDLATGEGLRGVLGGTDVVVHAASHPTRYRKVDLDGTRRMIKILRERLDPPHLIYISIVGVDLSPYPYYRAKYACELVLQRSGLPVTVVRATQFHSLVATVGRFCARGPFAVVPKGMAFQPCDHLWVADQLVALTLGEAPMGYRRASDLAGPERVTFVEAVNLAREAAGKGSARLVTLPVIGGALKSFAAGANLPGPDAVIGGVGYREWLRRAGP